MSKSSKRKRRESAGARAAVVDKSAESGTKRAPGLRLVLPVLAAIGIAAFLILRPRRAEVSAAGTGEPNVLLITLDTCRADHIGAYGRAAAATPAT